LPLYGELPQERAGFPCIRLIEDPFHQPPESLMRRDLLLDEYFEVFICHFWICQLRPVPLY
jgi:hypothetical protein